MALQLLNHFSEERNRAVEIHAPYISNPEDWQELSDDPNFYEKYCKKRSTKSVRNLTTQPFTCDGK